MLKPDGCSLCPFKGSSTGFVADTRPQLVTLSLPTLFALVTKFPTKDDLVEERFLSSKFGKVIEAEFLLPLGVRREQVLISSVLHCYPHGGKFPTGKEKLDAVRYCRRWDAALEAFRPDVWGVTVDPSDLLATPNQATFLTRSLRRAKEYADAGRRPVLLLGDEAKETWMPWLEGGLKKWQGHWEEYDPWERKAA